LENSMVSRPSSDLRWTFSTISFNIGRGLVNVGVQTGIELAAIKGRVLDVVELNNHVSFPVDGKRR